MRWSEFSQKQCVDVVNGERLGQFCDLKVDISTGFIESAFIPSRKSWYKRNQSDIEMKWFMVRKVGTELVIVDSNSSRQPVKSF